MDALMKLFSILALSLSVLSCGGKDGYVAFRGFAQGGNYTVKVNMKGVRQTPDQIKEVVDSLLLEVDRTLSGYNKSSMLSMLNSGETIKPNKMLCDVYAISRHFYEASDGAFDVASGPLFDVWGFGFTADKMPDDATVAEAMSRSGMGRLKADMASAIRPDGTLCAADLLLDGSSQPPVLNFNAIAQGFTCDYIAAYLHSLGIHDMLVDIGEIYCEGLNQNGDPWAIGIDRPVDGNNTPGADMQGVWHSSGSGAQGIVTSGNYRKFYVLDGKKYSHTIDPRTGRPSGNNLLSATIVAPDATTADAVATWCMVAGFKDSMLLMRELGLDACLIYDKDGTSQAWTTSGFGLSTLN